MPARQRTVVITGSTDGLGRELARRLAAGGDHVVLHGRDRARGEELQQEIGRGPGSAEFHQADFASLAEVRKVSAVIADNHPRIDLLISNAGVGPGGPENRREVSKDGFELRLAVNYLAGYLFTLSLTPQVLAAPHGRIVSVASAGQRPMDFNDPMLTRNYEREQAYCQAKLAQIMGTFDLAETLAVTGVTVNAVHPATFMDTTMVRETGFAIQSSLDDGVNAVLNVATSAALEGRTGLYFDQLRETPAHPTAYDRERRTRLRGLTLDWLGLPNRPLGDILDLKVRN